MDARWAQPCLVHTARKVIKVPEALEFNQVGEVNLKFLAIELFYEVCILCFDVLFQVVRMADYLSRRSSSATLPSPLTPFHPIVPREVHVGL